jgi:hypothetical protein
MKTVHSLLAAVALGCGLINCVGATPQPGASFLPAEAEQLQRLLEQRQEVASNFIRLANARYETGTGTQQDFHLAICRLYNAQLELCQTAEQRIALLEKKLAALKSVEQDTQRRFEAGVLPTVAVNAVRCDRLEAEIVLLRELRATRPDKPANDQQLRELQSSRLEFARTNLSLLEQRWLAGTTSTLEWYAAGLQVRDAELDLATAPAQQLAAHSNYLAWTKAAGQTVLQAYDKGTVPRRYALLANYWRYTAEAWWLRALGAATNEAFRMLLQKRCEAAAEVQRLQSSSHDAGTGSLNGVFEAVTQVRQAELDAATKQEQRWAAHSKYLGFMTEFEESQKRRFEAGAVPASALLPAREARLTAEIDLMRTRLAEKKGATNGPSLPSSNHPR